MENIKILVACHKPWDVYHDDVYIPIHVGRAISMFKDEMAEMIGDDTGDNISEKNPMYSELTAQYWAWKNMHDVDYIGFCHYRRYFKFKFTKENVDILKNKDMMVLKFYKPWSICNGIIWCVGAENFTILLMVLKKLYPDYEKTMIRYLRGNVFYPKNMFVCKKALFDKYAEWLFDILFECEKHIKLSPYTRAKRSLAYMGEFLLSVYIMHNHLTLKYSEIESKKKSFKDYIKERIWNFPFFVKRIKKPPKSLESFCIDYDAVLVGFKQDNIVI